MSHMMCCDVLLAHGHLTRGVHILSLDTIGCGMRWHDFTKNSFMFSCDSCWHRICSVAVLDATNSDPYVALSTVACLFKYESIGV